MDSFINILSGMSRYESKLQFVEGEKAQLQQVLPNYLGNFLLQYSLPTIVVSDALYQKVTKNSIQYQINAVNVDTKSREKLYEAVNKQIATEWQAPILYDQNPRRFWQIIFTGRIFCISMKKITSS